MSYTNGPWRGTQGYGPRNRGGRGQHRPASQNVLGFNVQNEAQPTTFWDYQGDGSFYRGRGSGFSQRGAHIAMTPNCGYPCPSNLNVLGFNVQNEAQPTNTWGYQGNGSFYRGRGTGFSQRGAHIAMTPNCGYLWPPNQNVLGFNVQNETQPTNTWDYQGDGSFYRGRGSGFSQSGANIAMTPNHSYPLPSNQNVLGFNVQNETQPTNTWDYQKDGSFYRGQGSGFSQRGAHIAMTSHRGYPCSSNLNVLGFNVQNEAQPTNTWDYQGDRSIYRGRGSGFSQRGDYGLGEHHRVDRGYDSVQGTLEDACGSHDGYTGTRDGKWGSTGTRGGKEESTRTRCGKGGWTGTRGGKGGWTGTRGSQGESTGTRGGKGESPGTKYGKWGTTGTRGNKEESTGTTGGKWGSTEMRGGKEGWAGRRGSKGESTGTKDGKWGSRGDKKESTGSRGGKRGSTETRGGKEGWTGTRGSKGESTGTRGWKEESPVGKDGKWGSTGTRGDKEESTGPRGGKGGSTETRGGKESWTGIRGGKGGFIGTTGSKGQSTGTKDGKGESTGTRGGKWGSRGDKEESTGIRSGKDRSILTPQQQHEQFLDFPFIKQHETVHLTPQFLVMFILRGLPGSGKTTIAEAMLQQYKDQAVVCSANYYCYNKDGEYVWDVNRLKENHEKCQRRAEEFAGLSNPVIIIDNTNVKYFEVEPYIKLSKRYGYVAVLVEPKTPWKFQARELATKNTHDVSFTKIYKKVEEYEVIIPVYFAWFVSPADFARLRTLAEDVLRKCLQVAEFQQCIKTYSGYWFPNFTIQNAMSYYSMQQSDSHDFYHVTACFSPREKRLAGSLYHKSPVVLEALGQISLVTITGCVVTNNTFSARVTLTEKQRELWMNDNQSSLRHSYDAGYNQASQHQRRRGICYSRHTTRHTTRHVQHSVEDVRRSFQHLPLEDGAGASEELRSDDSVTSASTHITLGKIRDINPVQAKYDVQTVVNYELSSRAFEEYALEGDIGKVRKYSDNAWAVYFNEAHVIEVPAIFSGYYD